MIEHFSQNFQLWAKKGGLETQTTSARSVRSGDTEEDTCAGNDLYRRIDGKCNNIANKHQGSAGIALKRFLTNSYKDGKLGGCRRKNI